MKKHVFFLLLIIAGIACNPGNKEYNPDLVGIWVNQKMYIPNKDEIVKEYMSINNTDDSTSLMLINLFEQTFELGFDLMFGDTIKFKDNMDLCISYDYKIGNWKQIHTTPDSLLLHTDIADKKEDLRFYIDTLTKNKLVLEITVPENETQPAIIFKWRFKKVE